jgi:protoporphyrinogen oxidase
MLIKQNLAFSRYRTFGVKILYYWRPELPDFSWFNIPQRRKIYQMTIKYTKLPQNIPNGHKIYQMATKYAKWPQNMPNFHNRYVPSGS